MANRRMFSLDIVDTDAFLDMPTSSQLLYFHLAMRADDDGFVGNPKKIQRVVGCAEDDSKVLVSKKFIIPFENGVCVVKHWKIHNYIQKDRYKETRYIKEKAQLSLKKNGGYKLDTKRVQNGDTGKVRLGKVRLGKVTVAEQSSADIEAIISLFEDINPSYKKWYANKTQRSAISRMLKTHGLEKLEKVIKLLPQTNQMDYMPVITTPLQLEDKFAQLATALQKYKNREPVIL